MKRSAFVYMLVLLLALSAVGVIAQGRMGMGRGMQQGNQAMTCQQMLGLSQAQMGEIQKLKNAFMTDTAALRTELQTKQQEMAKLWAAADPDVSQIKTKAAEMDQIKAQVRDKAIDLHYTIVTKVLTPAQRAKCAQCCQSGQCGMGCGMGPGAGCGMGMSPGAGMGPKGTGMGQCPMGGTGPMGAGCPMAK